LLGGSLAATTHTTKLGLRYAVDASPEPVSNGVMSLSELGIVASLTMAVWSHPYLALGLALLLLVILIVIVRIIWRTFSRLFSLPGRLRRDARPNEPSSS
jgi:hypothetical protein